MQRIIVSVINDLTTDQRVDKVCSSLKTLGFDVLLVGRKYKNSIPINRN
ncbi:MAG TPA: glycosyltransferase, partial [Flavobacteriaceae bacterium]|nr:glycosyltransferase [Flavobacteriaceae bacterium]